DLYAAVVRVAQDHVVLATATEIAETHDLPVQADVAEEASVCDVVVADVMDLKPAGVGIAQQYVSGVVTEEPGKRDEPPIGPDFAQLVGSQQRVAADVIVRT